MANQVVCGWCGTENKVGERATNQRFCSAKCRDAFWYDKRTKGLCRAEWRIGRYGTPATHLALPVGHAAYIAGFLDGEGHLGILRAKRAESRSGYRYGVVLDVSNTNREVLGTILQWLGDNGWIGNPERNNHRFPNAKPLYRLRFSRLQIREILPQIMPYLIVKREQAKAMMAYFEEMDKAPMMTSVVHPHFEALYQRCKALNKRGI